MIKVNLKRGDNMSTNSLDSGHDLKAKGYSKVRGRVLMEDKWFDDKLTKVAVMPNETILIKTGVHLEMPAPLPRLRPDGKIFGYDIMEAQVRNRSGLSLKDNTYIKWGTIDNEYRGDCGIMFWNNSDQVYTINFDDRIAQLVFGFIYKPLEGIGIKVVDELADSVRGGDGFGSTGV